MAPRHAARPSRSRSTKQIVAECGMMEHLEGRTLFGASPFPSLDDMRDPNNTVVRIETRYGNIDIELYDSLAPNTVTNFLRYVREGHYDQSVFHRHAANFVLQGGGFRYDGLPGATPALTAVPQYDQINTEFAGNQRSNYQKCSGRGVFWNINNPIIWGNFLFAFNGNTGGAVWQFFRNYFQTERTQHVFCVVARGFCFNHGGYSGCVQASEQYGRFHLRRWYRKLIGDVFRCYCAA
mgnify:CR=1 FL=1